MVLGPPKGTSLHRTASFDVFCVDVHGSLLAVGNFWNPKKDIPSKQWCSKSRMRGSETPYPICIKFCRVVDIPDVITYANFGEDRLRGLWVAGG